MSLRHSFITFLPLALLATSCSDDSDRASDGAGSLSLDVTVDATLRDPLTQEIIVASPCVPEQSQISVTMIAAEGSYSHTWKSLCDFPAQDLYYSGSYLIEAISGKGAEGFDTPCYSGSVSAVVEPDRRLTWPLTMHLVSSAFSFDFSPAITAGIGEVAAFVHTPGGEYHRVSPDESRLLYLTPGQTGIYLDVILPDGRHTAFRSLDFSALSGCFYECEVSADISGPDPVLTCSAPGKSASFTLSADFLSALPPSLTASGWTPGSILTVPEGEQPETPVRAAVTAAAPLSHLWLSVSSAYLSSLSFPVLVDLLHPSAEDEAAFAAVGLMSDLTSAGGSVDFTALIGKLVFLTDDEALSCFSLIAEDDCGRVSEPLRLQVQTTAVDISVTSVGDAPVGATSASLTVSTRAVDFASNVGIEILDADGQWQPASVLAVRPAGDLSYELEFAIPDGNADIRARILYCEEIRAEFTVERCMPEFELVADPFATYAMIRVMAPDQATVETVVRRLMLYVDGRRGPVLLRDEESGVLALSGLSPNTSYTLTATMMDRPDASDFTPGQRFTTEKAPALPNSDFEDRKSGVVYDRLPSGGRYSQTEVAIYNWQNRESFSQQVPQKWANTNAKTFSTRASNHNTWYMQPSVFTVSDEVKSGEFAVCLRSVGFDLSGEDIPDYAQTGRPYLQYSPVVPHVACRAAGKLFLGEYSFSAFSMEESYKDVVDWKSRPRSLNGFYKYVPSPDSPSDTGVAIIEIYGDVGGELQVIASARTYLPIANSYTAFTAPLSYTRFGIKASGMRLMFASSASIGAIAEESASVFVSADPVKGASLGSTLWIDNISLAY